MVRVPRWEVEDAVKIDEARIGMRVNVPIIDHACGAPDRRGRGTISDLNGNSACIASDCGCRVWWPYNTLSPATADGSAFDILERVAANLERQADALAGENTSALRAVTTTIREDTLRAVATAIREEIKSI